MTTYRSDAQAVTFPRLPVYESRRRHLFGLGIPIGILADLQHDVVPIPRRNRHVITSLLVGQIMRGTLLALLMLHFLLSSPALAQPPTIALPDATSTVPPLLDNLKSQCLSLSELDPKISAPLPSVRVSGPAEKIQARTETVTLAWSLPERPLPIRGLFHFIVITSPASIRLGGNGFLVLPPRARLPFGGSFSDDQLRAVFPLSLPRSQLNGELQIRPLLAGPIELNWAHVVLNACGVLAASNTNERSVRLQVIDRQPQIVIQNRIAIESSADVRLSPSREYELRIYDGRFEVLNAETGGLMFERFGLLPNFSPTSRFLAYWRGDKTYGPSGVTVYIDLLTSEDIATGSADLVDWAQEDAYVIEGGGSWGGLTVFSPWKDPVVKLQSNSFLSCHACASWNNSQLRIDAENALIWFRGSSLLAVVSLIDDLHLEGSDESQSFLDSLNPQLVVWYRLPRIWQVGDRLRITHLWDEVESSLKKFVITAPKKELPQQQERLPTPPAGSKGIAGSGGQTDRREVFLEAHYDLQRLPSDLIRRLADFGVSFAPALLPEEHPTGDWEKPRQTTQDLRLLAERNPLIADTYRMDSPQLLDQCAYRLAHDQPVDRARFWLWRLDTRGEVILVHSDCWGGAASSEIWNGNLNLYTDLEGEQRGYRFDSELMHLNTWRSGGPFESNRISAFLDEQQRLLVASIDGSALEAYDIRSGEVRGVLKDLPNMASLKSMHLSQDGALVLQINDDGRFYIYSLTEGRRILSGFYVDDEIVLFTGEGFYDGTPEGAQFVYWHFLGSRQHHAFAQFASEFHRPDIISGLLRGAPTVVPRSAGIDSPPVIRLKVDPDKNGTIIVRMTASSLRPLRAIRLFVDGVPAEAIPVEGTAVQLERHLDLPGHHYWVTAVASNDLGFSSPIQAAALPVDARPSGSTPRLFSLMVGIDHYRNIPRANLSFTARDVESLAEVLQLNPGQLYARVHTTKLTNRLATAAKVLGKLEALATEAQPTDTLLLYLAGHGVRDGRGHFYFLTSDASLSHLEQSALAWDRLAAVLRRVRSRVVVLLDACHSGLLPEAEGISNELSATELLQIARAGTVVLAAAKGRQPSLEFRDLDGGHGAFTYAVIRALSANRSRTDSNGNGVIEFDELYKSVRQDVIELTDGRQTPWIAINELVGPIPIF